MINVIRKLLWSLATAAMLIAGAADAADMNLATAINKAGRQRMLTQRITKTYVQMGLEVKTEQSRVQMQQAQALFDRQLAELKGFAPTPAIRQALTRVEQQWRPFRTLAGSPASKAGAMKLFALDDKLLFATNEVVRLLQDYSGYAAARLVNDAGRLRMLSQRLAKLYMLRAWGLDSGKAQEEMQKTRQEFETGLAALQAMPQNTYDINRELESAALQWTWFQNALEQEGEYQSYLLVVADASESLLSSMDYLTRLYEQLATK
jgi:nitrate/nitrite-specific signal transduction histidine kinase